MRVPVVFMVFSRAPAIEISGMRPPHASLLSPQHHMEAAGNFGVMRREPCIESNVSGCGKFCGHFCALTTALWR